jgi:hypothetical protein
MKIAYPSSTARYLAQSARVDYNWSHSRRSRLKPMRPDKSELLMQASGWLLGGAVGFVALLGLAYIVVSTLIAVM